jgi:very-short-patch-repair endonuclease
MLRDRSLSRWKFRRQHPIGFFVLGFYCPRLALAIELDGAGHFDEPGAAGDAYRSAALALLGIEVIRFENAEVLECGERVLGKICDVIAAIEASRFG